MIRWWFGALCGLLAAAPTEAPLGQPHAQVLGQRTGFTGTYPGSVRVDPAGRLWVSTDLGSLFVGDGLRFLNVPLPHELASAGAEVGAMEVDPAGRVWLLSTQGLATWDQGQWRVAEGIRLEEVSAGRRAEGIFLNGRGELAVLASGSAHLIPLRGAPQPLALPEPGQPGDLGLMWRGDRLVTRRGARLWQREGGQWLPLPSLPLERQERVRGPLRADLAGHLYAMTEQRLLHLAPGAQGWRTLDHRPGSGGDRAATLEDGRVWILQAGRAVTVLEGRLETHPLPPGLSLYGAEAKCLDREGNLWIATTSLIRLPAYGLMRVHTPSPSPLAREVWRIHRDPKGRLWVATEGGVFRWDAQGWCEAPGLPSSLSVEPGPDGAYYVHSRQRLMRVDPDTLAVSSVPLPRELGGPGIRRGPVVLGEDLYALSGSGWVVRGRLGPGGWTWERIEAPPVDVGKVSTLAGDPAGRLWIFLSDRALCREAGRWTEVDAIKGRGIVGLRYRGPEELQLVQFSPPTVLALRQASGTWRAEVQVAPEQLPGVNVLYSSAPDGEGNLWLNSDRGLLRLSAASHSLQRYGTEVGLPTEDTNQDALLVEGLDRVWVGTPEGLAELRLAAGPRIPSLTAPLILETRTGSQRQTAGGTHVELRHGEGPVVWELGFPGPVRGEGARFQFREAGGTWAELAGTALQFPEISPGTHRYEVRVHASMGEVGPPLALVLVVRPPWYRHPVAYGLWGLLLAGGVFGAVRWRMARLQRRNRELTAAVDAATAGLRARERELEEVNRRLYVLNEAKRRVIGLAAHDLRNPLSGILLNCDLLEDVPDPEVQRLARTQIRTLGATMKSLIQRLLDVHAIEAGHAEAPRIEPVDLQDALTRCRAHHLSRAQQKGMPLELEAGAPAWAEADRVQVGQILDNFISNALKYAPPGTRVQLRVRAGEASWRVEVQDEGPGLTEEDHLRVFGEYARLSARPTGEETSVGLGLALARHLAEGMGGRVGVDSTAGFGATFWVELPAC